MIDLSIIIVSYNVVDLLAACLDTILASPIAINERHGDKPVMEIIVVDSASQDNTVAMVGERYPQVKVFTQAENIGFVRGNNMGLESARGRYLLLLNPDTEVIGDALPQMIAYLDNNPSVGIVGPRTLNSDGTDQSTRRRFPSKALAFFESTWLQPFAPQSMLDTYTVADRPDVGVYEVDWVQGSALMARRDVYDQIGGLDAGFVMYSEELDWCKRAKGCRMESRCISAQPLSSIISGRVVNKSAHTNISGFSRAKFATFASIMARLSPHFCAFS